MMDLIKRHKTAIPLLLGTVFLSLLLKRSFPLVVYTIGLLVVYFPLRGHLAGSMVFRATVALVTLLCLFQMEAMLFWALDIWVSPLVYIVVSLLIVATGLWALDRRETSDRPAIKLGRLDVLFILPSLLIGGVYLTGTLAPAEKDDATIVRSIMYGMDDATHANIFADVLRHDSNILAGAERSKLMNKSVHASYPMGWHVSASITGASLAGSQDRSPIESIEVYFYAKVLTLMLAVTSVTILVYSLARQLWPKLSSLVTITGVAGISVFVSSLLILPLFFDGFFSFIPIILYTAIFAAIAIDNKNRLADTIFLALLAAASSLTWMLTGPILIVAFVLYYFGAYGSTRKLPRKVYAGIVVSGIFLLAQAYILYSANKNSFQNIANEGGIVNPEHMLLLAGLVAFFVLWTRKSQQRDAIAKPLFGLVAAYIVVLSLLLLYLSVQTSEITYYYYKLQVPLLVVLVPLLCVYVFGILFNAERGGKFAQQALVLFTGFAVLAISIPSIIGYSYVYDIVNRAHSYVISPADAALLVDKVLSKPVSNSNERTNFMFPASAPRNILASNIDKLGYRSTGCDYELFAAAYTYDLKALDKTLNECAAQLPLIRIYTNDEGKAQMLNQLDPLLIEKNEVELVVI